MLSSTLALPIRFSPSYMRANLFPGGAGDASGLGDGFCKGPQTLAPTYSEKIYLHRCVQIVSKSRQVRFLALVQVKVSFPLIMPSYIFVSVQ